MSHPDAGITPALLDEITDIASRAAQAVLAIAAHELDVRHKSDRSPVTAADEAAQAIILEGLSRLLHGVPIVSEEAALPTALGDVFVLVDPIDGTKEFVKGRDEYTVNIGLVQAGMPVLGVIGAPAKGLLWRGAAGLGAEALTLAAGAPAAAATARQPMQTRKLVPAEGAVAVVSRSHLDPQTTAYLAERGIRRQIACGSSLKFCELAAGHADLYPRLAPISEWDIAAGHALVHAAGGRVVTPAGTPLPYGRIARGFEVDGFIAYASAES